MPTRCQLLSGSLPFLTRPSRTISRTFTSSPCLRLQKRKGGDLGSHLPKHVLPKNQEIPAYPHGPSHIFKQSNKGLYGGSVIQFGNNVSPDTETKTRRHWKPNVLSKSLYSITLKKKIKLRVTAKVLKTIDKVGGLDEYLLGDSASGRRVKELGVTGWNLRFALMQMPVVRARMRAEAAALGLAQEKIDEQWPDIKPVVAPKLSYNEKKKEVARSKEDSRERLRIKKAARKYVRRGWCETMEEGRALAVERAPLRKAARERNERMRERHFELVKKAGGIEAWKTGRAERLAKWIEEAGGKEAWEAMIEAKKAKDRVERMA
ncbi:hypothetical protein K469DRAFT_707936 [Zopfia rhizophila CBS 207.26]|uniref:Large ribosomal subunit protein bL28m n=1 Tax=Zopfia rhizophila CBS 207.26 TaxID=1314779 RepID=A0A6A6E353_9PEZI|nr:hypothetical protein K469DRAFT_707936 [Zopfia rhizophila CBS 207.26]